MIQVLAGEDNDFGTNSGCKMHVFVQLHTVNVLGKSFKITITIDRDQAWDVEAQCKTTICFMLKIDDDDEIENSTLFFTTATCFMISVTLDRDRD